MKKIIAFLCLVVWLTFFINNYNFSIKSNNPFLSLSFLINKIKIKTPQDLQELAMRVNAGEDFSNSEIILLNDLDFSNIKDFGITIGTLQHPFTGFFNGNQKAISGIKITAEDYDYIGLFGVAKQAVIKNVYLENIEIKGKNHVGGLVGLAENVCLEKCVIHTGVVHSSLCSGGMVGIAKFTQFIQCSNQLKSVKGHHFVAGFAGFAQDCCFKDSKNECQQLMCKYDYCGNFFGLGVGCQIESKYGKQLNQLENEIEYITYSPYSDAIESDHIVTKVIL